MHFMSDDDRWNVLTVLILHTNIRNRCWPSTDLLARQGTHGNKKKAIAAKKWLREHKAFVLVPHKKRFGDEETALPQRQHIYELTGYIQACNNPECACGGNGKRYKYLYHKSEPESFNAETFNGKTFNGESFGGKSFNGGTGSMSSESLSTESTSNQTSSNGDREKRETVALAKLAIADIRFSKTDFPDRPTLMRNAIEQYGYKTVLIAIDDAHREGAKFWSYVAAKLEAQRPAVMTGEDYITGIYADYIDH